MKKIKEIGFEYYKVAKKFFEKHIGLQEKFEENIKSFLREEDSNIDIIKIKGSTDLLRMRINDYRIIYRIFDKEIVIIEVVEIGSRGSVYKKMK